MRIAALPGIQRDAPLAPYTTFKVGGPADWFLHAKSADDVRAALAAARADGVPIIVLGGGSNVLVADAGVLLTRVTQIKGKGSQRYLGVDTGMDSLIRPTLYDAWHEIVNLTRVDAPAEALYQVVGPICDSGDVLGTDRRLPEAQEGDVMLIAQAGAYGKVMSSRYNLREEADEVILDD